MTSMTKIAPNVNHSPSHSTARRRPDRSEAMARQVHRASLGLRTRQLAWMISRIYDEQLGPLGLSESQFELLAVVISRGRTTTKELAGQLHLDGPSINRTLDTMIDAGWLTSETLNGSGSRQIQWTRSGKRLFEEALPAWKRAQTAATELLGTEGTHAMTTHGDSQAMW